jgi:hypothetical protein
MQDQNFKNHSRYVVGWHFIAPLGLLAVLIGSIINLINSDPGNLYSASLLVAISVLLWFVWFFERVFALKAQDRAIRAEENFRHYVLTGKPLDNRLTIRQVIGLRFASDAEFPALAIKAAEEGISEKDIKKSVASWKADTYRV